MAANIAHRAGLDKLEVVNVAWDALVAGQTKDFDLALSQISITDERKKVVDFSVPYFSSDIGVLVKKGTKVDADLDQGHAHRRPAGDHRRRLRRREAEADDAGQRLSRHALDVHRPAGRPDRRRHDRHLDRPGAGRRHRTAARRWSASTPPARPTARSIPKGSTNAATIDKIIQALIDDGTLEDAVGQVPGAPPGAPIRRRCPTSSRRCEFGALDRKGCHRGGGGARPAVARPFDSRGSLAPRLARLRRRRRDRRGDAGGSSTVCAASWPRTTCRSAVGRHRASCCSASSPALLLLPAGEGGADRRGAPAPRPRPATSSPPASQGAAARTWCLVHASAMPRGRPRAWSSRCSSIANDVAVGRTFFNLPLIARLLLARSSRPSGSTSTSSSSPRSWCWSGAWSSPSRACCRASPASRSA